MCLHIQVANRVAEERGALLGHEVGYTIRFDDCSDPHATRIKVGTIYFVAITMFPQRDEHSMP